MIKTGYNPLYTFVISILLLSNILLFTACDFFDNSYAAIEADTLTFEQTDEMLKAEAIAIHDTFPFIKYNHSMIRDKDHRNEIYREYLYDGNNWSKNKTFRTLHREELIYLRAGEKLVIPDTFISDQRAYSIFPAFYWEARHIHKIIIVSNAFQVYAAYEYGRLVRFAATNTGKESTQTYPGRYSLAWKEREHRSSLDSNWIMPYNFNFHSNAGSAFHQFTMPGRPVSHSCCRQFMDDAKWLFYWGRGYRLDSNRRVIPLSGTPVIIIDYFDFSRKRGGPWLELKSNKDTLLELPKDPMAVEWALIPLCQIPESSRWNLPGGLKRYIHAEDTLRAMGIIRPHVNLIKTKNYNAERRRKQAAEEKKRKLEEANQYREIEEPKD
ncbi:MAG: L,D-transpeptidase [bacterium]